MNVRLIAVTKPTIEECDTAEELVAYCARVSNPKNQDNKITAPKLMNTLIREGHWSPLEMAHVVMEIETTRDIARQILRHRSFSFQEFCVAGNTKISTITNSGKVKLVTIEDLYKRQQSAQYSAMSDWLVRVYDEEEQILKPAKVVEVFKTGKKQCYNLTLVNGKTIQATGDHKFLVKGKGFIPLSEIDLEDFVSVNGVPVYQNKDWLEQAKKQALENKTGVQGIADIAGCSYHTIRKWLKIHNLQFSKAEVASYTSIWNKGLPKEQQPKYGKPSSKETRLKQSESARKGKESNLYINGNQSYDTIPWRQRVAQVCKGAHLTLLVRQDYKCADCGNQIDKKSSQIDHILPVFMYPELAFDEDNNLQTLCVPCHEEKTALEATLHTVGWSKVSSISEAGELETYDMEVDHKSHNYVANGIITHNSQRYAEVPGMTEPKQARLQDNKNRQNSLETEDNELQEWWQIQQEILMQTVQNTYKAALAEGIAKEVARVILPEGLTQSRLYMSGTLRSWIHYCQLRRGNGTQKEHIQIADACWDIICKEFPTLAQISEVHNG